VQNCYYSLKTDLVQGLNIKKKLGYWVIELIQLGYSLKSNLVQGLNIKIIIIFFLLK